MSQELEIAFIGLVGVIAGSALSIAGQIATYCLRRRSQDKLDMARKKLLLQMLEHSTYKWRSLERLAHVVGADEDTTKRLLLELGARASEDGKPLWGLLRRNPFENEQ